MFKIDTSKVTEASSEVKAAAKTLDSCLSSVQGYNVSCDGEDFPFDAAKNSIINSIQICQSKLQNTADSLEKVASIHEELQNTLAKGDYEEKPPEQASSDSSSSSGYTGGGGGYSSGGGHSSGGHSSSSGAKVAAISSVAGTTAAINSVDDDIDADLSQLTESELNSGVVDSIYIPAFVGIETLPGTYTEEQKQIFENVNLKTDNDGYLKLDNKYIISCNSSVGKVGDVVTITTKTGSNVECIIGSVNENNNLNMYVNNTGSVTINNSVTSGFTNNIQSITNNSVTSTSTNVNVNQAVGTTSTVDTNTSEVSAAGGVPTGASPTTPTTTTTTTTTDDLNKDNTNDAVNDNSDGSEQ